MNGHWHFRSLSRAKVWLLAALLAAAPMATAFAGGTVSPQQLYDAGKALGIPAILSVGAANERLLATGDFDGDGIVDLAVGDGADEYIAILTGDGQGRFSDTGISRDGRPRMLAHADVDGDGLDDEIVNRSPALVYSVRLAAGGGSGAVALVADFNRDGVADLAVSDGNRLAIYHGGKDGSLRASARLTVGGGVTGLAIGDFNGDGVADLAAATGRDSIALFVGDGLGGFGPRRDIAAGINAAGLLAADLDGDGLTDLAAADERSDEVAVILNDGRGGFRAPWLVEAAAPSAAAPYAAPASNATVYEGVASLTLNPAVVTGGTGITSFGTVTLNAPAPAGGVVVMLASSNVELAATVPSIAIPAGAIQGTFTVATNVSYRKYSGLPFNVAISATHAATVTATLTVTAQPPPADFSSGSTAGANTQWSGSMCGGIAPIGGNKEILYNCSPAPTNTAGFGSCTFQQECSIGCRRVPPGGGAFNDFCAATGPNAVAVSRNYFISGDHVPATVVTEAPVAIPTTGVPGALSLEANARGFSPDDVGGLHFPVGVGATSMPFDVATSYVPAIEFVDVNGFWYDADIPPFLITNGRGGHAWVAMVPPDPPPALPIPTPVQFKIVGANPVTGGQSSIGQLHLSGVPHGIGPTIAFTSSHPTIVPAPASVTPPASNILGFDVSLATQPPAANTDVTLTATDGRYTFSAILGVLVPPPAPLLAGVSVNPTSVVGGNPAIGTVTLSAAQSGATVVRVSIIDSAPATLPASNPACSPPPSSRCHNVTVPAGATSASFAIATSAVTGQFNLGIFADLPAVAGNTGKNALLLITPAGAGPALSTLSVNPTTVVGGTSSTGTVTLTGPAPSGGALIGISTDSAFASVPDAAATGAITVPAGATSASFTITTRSDVPATTTVTINAGYNVTFRAATLTVTVPPGPGPQPLLSALTLNPATVVGGNPSTGTVTLSAPQGQARLITLISFLPAVVTVPANVTVPAGATSASFAITTRAVTGTVEATIFSSLGVPGEPSREAILTLTPVPAGPTLTALSLNPTGLVGPASATGTVTLSAAAPAGGSLVTLNSNTAVVTVPANVTVAAGATSATFAVATRAVAASVTATISGILGTTRSATLMVHPPGATATLSAVSLNPTSVDGGGAATGTVTLSAAAPAGGAVVSLSNNSTAATVPVSVTVLQGATSAIFTVTTGTVTATTTATISAAYAGVTRTAALTVRAVMFLNSFSVSPASVTGGTSTTGAVRLSAAAPAGGTVVSLSSQLPGSASVPASVTVLAGQTSASFTVTTFNVAATTVSLTATLGQVTLFASIVVNSPASSLLNALTLSPASVAGGASSTGTVTLSATRPESVVVNLSTNSATATVPTSVTIPAGGASASFTITTTSVAASTAVLITAVPGPITQNTQTAVLTVTPPGAATLSTVALSPTSVVGGNSSTGTVTMSAAAPSGGAAVSLSDNSSAASVPASITVAAGATSATFTVTTTSVTASTTATISAVYAGVTRTAALTVNPSTAPAAPTLLSPASDATPAQPVTFDWSDVATATSYEIQIDDSSTIAAPFRANQIVNVSQVTIGGLPAQRLWWRVRAINSAGVAGPFSATRRFTPQAATSTASLSALAVNPTSVVGGNSSTGTVTLSAAAPSGGIVVTLSDNSAATTVPASVTVAAGAANATFTVTTSAVTANTSATLTAAFNGVSRTATLTVTPPATTAAALSAVSLSPTSVVGGTSSTGTVTLSAAAPSGGAAVTLASNNAAASVPANVTVAAGASSATFTVTTTSVTASATATISAVLGAVTRTAALTVNPPASTTTATLTVTATGRGGESIVSSPAGINVAVGSTGSASFANGTAITLSVAGGRDAIWSGACSSGGNKARTCVFTITGNASVTGNVQ